VGSVVLRDRKHLAEDGLLVIVCTIDAMSGSIASGPDIVSRGFVYVRESESLMNDVREAASNTIRQCLEENFHDWSTMKAKTKDAVSRLIFERTKRDPMILPILMEV
jgi:ribonuclease J